MSAVGLMECSGKVLENIIEIIIFAIPLVILVVQKLHTLIFK